VSEGWGNVNAHELMAPKFAPGCQGRKKRVKGPPTRQLFAFVENCDLSLHIEPSQETCEVSIPKKGGEDKPPWKQRQNVACCGTLTSQAPPASVPTSSKDQPFAAA
jgi:hypothetical protein